MTLATARRNIVVIGASAGGVEALQDFFRSLPADTPAAFLVVLHIPAHTPSQLDRVLSAVTRMPVVVACNAQSLEPGIVYVAQADRHLMLDDHGVRVTRGPKECRVRPAVDVLFRSAASSYGERVIGVVLSGALDDGTAGLWAIKDANGLALAQSPAQAVYDSMPRSAIAHVATDFVGTVEELAVYISGVVGGAVVQTPVRSDRHAIENIIGLEGNGLQAGVMTLGAVSKYTCPDCHGVLVQIEEGPIVRFRCHTGHAFTVKTLIAEVNATIDTSLWSTLRAVEERVMLLRQMSDLAERAGDMDEMSRCRQQASDAEVRLKPLRDLVLDPDFFGHAP